MAEMDLYLTKLLEDKERFADLINVQIFGGDRILKPEELELLSNQSGVVVTDKNGMKRTIQKRRDVVMKASFGTYFSILACENQSNVHYAMSIRTMLYDALDYMEQVEDLEKQHKEDGDMLTGDEFLSRIMKDDRLVPVVSLVLYYGKHQWDGAKSLHEMTGLTGDDEILAKLIPYVPNYSINLIHVRNMNDIESFQTCLQQIFSMLKYNSDKKKLYAYIREHRQELKDMDSTSMMALLALLGEQKRLGNVLAGTNCEEGQDMCNAIDDLIHDGIVKGKAEGTADSILVLLSETGDIPEELQNKVLQETDMDILTRWLKSAAKAESIADFQQHM